VCRAAAHAAGVIGGFGLEAARLGGLLLAVAEGLVVAGAAAAEFLPEHHGPFVVGEVVSPAPGALLEHHDAVAGTRQLAGDDAAGGTGADDHEVDDIAGIAGHRGVRAHASASP
jgi:hypothetical protein